MSYSPKQLALSYHDQTALALSEMILFDKILALKSFHQIIFNPKLSVDEKKSIVSEILNKNLSQNCLNFVLFLIQENSLKNFSEIFGEFKKICKEKKIAVSGTATSSVPMSDDEIKKLEQDLSQNIGTPVILELMIKPDLLGGVVIEVDGQTYDNSFQSKLNKLKT